MGKRELIDIAAEQRGETERAFRIFDGKTTEWVPKSYVDDRLDVGERAPPRPAHRTAGRATGSSREAAERALA